MYRDAWRNVDGKPLQADHTRARAHGGQQLADRLLLAACNTSLGAVLGNQLRGARRHGRAGPTPRPRVQLPEW